MNDIVHLLSNRASSFDTSLFNTPSGYKILEEESKTLKNARSVLTLANDSSDWYLKGVLQSVLAFKELQDYIGTFDTQWFYPFMLKHKTPTVEGGRFASNKNPIRLTWNPAYLPKSMEITIEYADASNALVTKGGEKPYYVGITIFGDKQLEFNEPLLEGCSFGILLDNDWEVNAKVHINIEPTRYPYDEAAAKIAKSKDAINILNKVGLLDSFYSTPDSFYRVAVYGAAIAQATKNELNG